MSLLTIYLDLKEFEKGSYKTKSVFNIIKINLINIIGQSSNIFFKKVIVKNHLRFKILLMINKHAI